VSGTISSSISIGSSSSISTSNSSSSNRSSSISCSIRSSSISCSIRSSSSSRNNIASNISGNSRSRTSSNIGNTRLAIGLILLNYGRKMRVVLGIFEYSEGRRVLRYVRCPKVPIPFGGWKTRFTKFTRMRYIRANRTITWVYRSIRRI